MISDPFLLPLSQNLLFHTLTPEDWGLQLKASQRRYFKIVKEECHHQSTWVMIPRNYLNKNHIRRRKAITKFSNLKTMKGSINIIHTTIHTTHTTLIKRSINIFNITNNTIRNISYNRNHNIL